MTDDKFARKVEKARRNVKALDKVDGYQDRNAGTILAALECGLKHPETNAQFDAYVMLEDLRNQTQRINKDVPHTTLYQETDFQPGDVLLQGENGLVIRRGNTDIHLRWANLQAYADWMLRNADHLPGDAKAIKEFGNGLNKHLQENP